MQARNFVVDSGGVPLARGVNRGVGQISYVITVCGAMAHASSHGGKNAALFSGRLIGALGPGPAGTSSFLHVASVECPGSPNTIPDRAVIQGQLLYSDLEEAERILAEMRNTAAALARETGFRTDFSVNYDCPPWTIPEDDPLVVYAREAAARTGLPFHLGQTGAGSDAQVMAHRGGRVLKISTGMLALHSGQENIDLEDMRRCLGFLWTLAGQEPGELKDF
jgi:tripeptide aminopeptidase